MNTLILNEYRELFRNQESYNQFVQKIREKMGKDLTAVISDGDVVGSTLSPEATKEILYERMVKKIAKNPSILDEIADRLEHDDIVE